MTLPLESDSLLLRRFTARDAATVLALSHEPAYRAWLPSQVYEDLAEAAAALEFLIGQYADPPDPLRAPFVLGIEEKVEHTLIGHVGLSAFEGEVEIGFAIAQHSQGRGLAREAIACIATWAFAELGLRRILGITAVSNLGARRAMEHAGFVHQRDREMRFQGTEQTVSVYVLTPDHPARG